MLCEGLERIQAPLNKGGLKRNEKGGKL